MANLTATASCFEGLGQVDLVYTGTETPASFKYEIIYNLEVFGTYTGGSSITVNDLPDGTGYTAKVYDDTDPGNPVLIGESDVFDINCGGATPDPILSATVTCNTDPGYGQVDVTVSDMDPDTAYTYDIQLLDEGGALIANTGANRMTSRGISNAPTGSYTLRLIEHYNGTAGSSWDTPLTVDCGYAPEAGTLTLPAPKYMAVGGTLPNPIEYSFAFAVNDPEGNPKTGHYVMVNIYKEDETTPSATTRARVRNGAAKVDVSRYVRALLGIIPPAGADIVQADSSALVRYHIGFVEVWTGGSNAEVLAADKYAVNAALQSTVNDFTDHVIQPTL